MVRRAAMVMIAAALVAEGLNAHHSTARFDPERTLEFEGVVTDYEWANPHVYNSIASGEREWLVEGYSPSIMRRAGWSGDTLHVGDRIAFVGRPERDAETDNALLVAVRRDGEELFDLPSAFSAAARLDASAQAESLN